MSPKRSSVSKGRNPTHIDRRHSVDAAPPAEQPPVPAPSAPPTPIDDDAAPPAEQPPSTAGTRYLTREQQLQELLGVIDERDRRLARALVDVFTSASPHVLASFGRVLAFVAQESGGGER